MDMSVISKVLAKWFTPIGFGYYIGISLTFSLFVVACNV